MLEKDPKKRITMQKIIDNKWINEGKNISLNEEII